jgi:hypothetical protein
MTDCCYPAIHGNSAHGQAKGPQCCAHCQQWFPVKKQKGIGNNGHLLLGVQYLLSPSTKVSCICGTETCVGIGYLNIMKRADKTLQDEDPLPALLSVISLNTADHREKVADQIINKYRYRSAHIMLGGAIWYHAVFFFVSGVILSLDSVLSAVLTSDFAFGLDEPSLESSISVVSSMSFLDVVMVLSL